MHTAHVELSSNRGRSTGYVPRVPRKTEPSALVSAVIQALEKLRKARGITQKALMRAAGGTQQQWNRWTHGASPKVTSLEAVARALDAELLLEVRDRRTAPRQQTAPPAISAASVEIAAVVDGLPEHLQQRIVEAVHRLAGTFARIPPQPNDGEARNQARGPKSGR